MVILHDDKSFEAEVVGKDPKTDVALLKINPKDTSLKAVKFGNSNNLRDYKNNEIYLSPRKLWRPPTPPKKYSNKGLNKIK